MLSPFEVKVIILSLDIELTWPRRIFSRRVVFLIADILRSKNYGVAISTFFHRSRGCFRPNCGCMAAQQKLHLRSSSTLTVAAAERMNILISYKLFSQIGYIALISYKVSDMNS